MVFKKSHFFIHAGSMINFTTIFRSIFQRFFLPKMIKTFLERMYGKVSKNSSFFVVLETLNRQKGTKKGDFFEACCPKGCPEASGDASGTNFDAPGRSFGDPRKAFWDSQATLWDHSGRLGRLFGPSWAHVGKQIAANGRKQQRTAVETSN